MSFRVGGFELSARRVAPWPPVRRVRWLAVILLVSASLGIRGLDWGLPYRWHPDEKIDVADTMVRERSLEPPHFINPSLHAYVTYVAIRMVYALAPRQTIRYRLDAIVPLTDPTHPDRQLQFLSYRLSRLFSVFFQLGTVLLAFKIATHTFDETIGLITAWFTAVTMGLINMAHFATGESLLFLLCLWALWRFAWVTERGAWRDYAWAGVATGFACSTKYTPWILAVPFLVAHLTGRGTRLGLSGAGVARMSLTFVCTIGGFVATSPFAVLSWPSFRQALIITWYTGAPTGSLAHSERSWIPYIGILGNALGWPLFALALAGLVLGLWRVLHDDAGARVRALFLIHIAWTVSFYLFYGITPHRELRFILPIAPTLVLFAAVAAIAMVRAVHRPWVRRAGMASIVFVGLYSTVYSARASHMFTTDTRYTAARWLQALALPSGMSVDYLAVEAYLPHFDRPSFPIHFVPYVMEPRFYGSEFWRAMLRYFDDPAHGVIVDADFYYLRYFTRDGQARHPDRARLYGVLLTGQESPFRTVARITAQGPWWLDPRPEFVSPEVVVFATRAAVPDSAMMPSMPPAPQDVMRVIGPK